MSSSGAEGQESVTSIPLREWTERALETVNISAVGNDAFTSSFGADSASWPAEIRRSLALSSDSFLMSAVKVALSLADQICQAEGGHGEGVTQRLLPTPGPDWAGRVAVHVSSSSNDHQRSSDVEVDVQPLPFSPQESGSEPVDLQAMLNSLIPDESLFTQAEGADSGVSYHSVLGSEILPSPKDGNGHLNDRMKRIHSLGIVFYELFSGGERYCDTSSPQVNSKHVEMNGRGGIKEDVLEPLPHDNALDFEPVPHGDTSTFDLAGKLNILDNMSELFEGADNGDIFNSNGEPSNGEQMRNRKRTTVSDGSRRSESAEPLKLQGLPTSLCNLIGNMIDCINGDLSGNESYSAMADVRCDLQLMLENPNRFLYDMDLEKLAVTGLPLNEAVFARDEDFAALKDSCRRAISGENEIGIVVGQSGVGKSVLAQQLGSFVTATGGLFFSGKFDQLQQAKPFSALASAFNEYCDKMLKEGRSDHMQKVASELRVALGRDSCHLVKVIPNLSMILGGDDVQPDDDQECVDAQKRLQYLLCRFVDIISRFSGSPVILFLDDLQWADPASLGAINQLLMVGGSGNVTQHFFFLGSCRPEGVLEEHPFGNMLSNLFQFGLHATIVELACMDKDMTNTIISELLCLPPRLTRTFTEIVHHRTKGNPLFFSQLLLSLYKDGLLRLSLSRRRWEWDEEQIQSRKLPDDVAEFMAVTIGRLPKDVQTSLCTLACFGNSSEIRILEVLESKFGIPIIETLDCAVAEGLVDKVNGAYSFGHDRLQEAAYNMIQPEDRCLFHFKYGVAIVPRALELQEDGDSELLFQAASQINRGGPAAVQDIEQAILIANLNLTAGQKAMEMSDFTSAFSFFDNGISFLRKRHWSDYYDLSLTLFGSAAKCALVIGDIVTLKLLSEQVLTYAQSFQDTLDVLFITVTALAYASQLPESINRSVMVLSQLGEELPESYSEMEIKFCIEQTKIMLQGFSDEELIGYKIMDDPTKIMAMNFYARLELSFQMTKPVAQPVVTVKMVQLSIARGMSPTSPLGFAYFGQLLAALGEVREGTRYVKIAEELLNRIGSKEVAGEVLAVATQVLCIVEPLQAKLEHHIQGELAAMAAGDTHAALLNSILHLATSFWAGTKLSAVKKHYEQTRRLCQEHNHVTFLSLIIEIKRYFVLMGTDDDVEQKASPNQAKEAVEEVKGANLHAVYGANFQTMYISYLLRDFDQTKALAEKHFKINIHTWNMMYIHTNHCFYGGLVSFWIYRQLNDPVWASRGFKAKDAVTKWADSSEWNFRHKAYLLEAEEAFCNKNVESAKYFYEKAVSTAREHRFINEEALSCELAGYFFLEIEEKDRALQFFMNAHERYHEWGAVAKSNTLFEYVQKVLCPAPGPLPRKITDSFSSNDGLVGSNRRKRWSDRSE